MANAWPATLVIALLMVTPGLLFHYDVTPKVAVLAIGVALALPAGIRRLPALLVRQEGRWLAALLALQLLSFALATLAASNPELSIGGSNWRRFGLLTEIAVLGFALTSAAVLAARPALLTVWLRIFAAGGALASFYICCQYFGLDPLLPAEAYRIGEGEWAIVRPPGTLGHAGYAATCAVYSVFAGIAVASANSASRTAPGSRGAIDDWIGWGAAGLGAVAVVLSGTRGAMVALVAGGLWMLWTSRPRVSWRGIAVGVGLAVSAVGFYLAPMGQALRSRVRWSAEDPLGGARLELWRDSARMGAERWWVGWGPESFSAEFPRFQSESLARAYPDFYHESPHNIFVEAWTAQGAPGLLVLLALCGLGIASGLRAGRRGRSDPARVPAARPAAPATVQAITAGLVAGIVSQIFLSSTAITAVCFYWFVAMLVAMACCGEVPEADAVMRPGPRSRSRLGWAALPAALVALVLLVYAGALIGRDWMLAATQRRLAEGRLVEASEAYTRSRAWAPPGVTADLWFSRALLEAARQAPVGPESARAVAAAVEAANRATRNAEDPHNALYSRAQMAAVQSDVAAIERNLRSAIEQSPAWFKPHWTLAELLLLGGRIEEAEAAANRAVDLDGGHHAEVAATLSKVQVARLGRVR